MEQPKDDCNVGLTRRELLAAVALAAAGVAFPAWGASPESSAARRARNIVDTYIRALREQDKPTLIRLGDANMRSLIERRRFSYDDVQAWIAEITFRRIRLVEVPEGVAYIGWVMRGTTSTRFFLLSQLLVGEAQAVSNYTALREHSVQTSSREWKLAVMPMREWCSVSAQPQERERLDRAVAAIDAAVWRSWYFEGGTDARRDIERILENARGR